jgi:hypothetical protein
LYIENSSSSNQGWGCNRSSKEARRVKTQLSLFQTKHQPSLQKGYQKRTSVCIKLNKDPTTPSVRI